MHLFLFFIDLNKVYSTVTDLFWYTVPFTGAQRVVCDAWWFTEVGGRWTSADFQQLARSPCSPLAIKALQFFND